MKLFIVDLKTKSLQKEIRGFPEDFEIQAATQVKGGFFVIIASRTCFLLKLDEILFSEETQLHFKQFPMPDTAQFDKSYIDACFLDNQLIVATFAKDHGVKIHRCSVNPVIECEDKVQEVQWKDIPVFEKLKHPEKFKSIEIVERYYCSLSQTYKAGGHASHN